MAVSRKTSHKHAESARPEPEPGQQTQKQHGKGSGQSRVRHARPSGDLDHLIHERTRLGLVSALASHKTMSFTELKTLLNISDGNLSAHARKLEEAGYIECSKGFEGRVPRTEYTLNATGRKALNRYVVHMEALIAAMKK